MADGHSSVWQAVAAIGALLAGVAAVAGVVLARNERVSEAETVRPAEVVVGARAGTQRGNLEANIDPSFDCRKAITPVERAICGDPALAAIDRELGRAFSDRLAVSGDQRQAVLTEQREWLRERDQNCQDQVSCLTNWTNDRIAALRS